MAEEDVISVSSSSRPSSPFIDVSEVFNDSEKRKSSILNTEDNIEERLQFGDGDCNTPDTFELSTKYRTVHNLSESDDDNGSSSNNINHELKRIENITSIHCTVTEEKGCSQGSCEGTRPSPELSPYLYSPQKKRKVDSRSKPKMSKEQRIEEMERKRKEKEKIRLEKRAAQELQNQMKPANCIKFMRVVLDSSLLNCPFGGILLADIQNSGSKYEVTTQDVPYSVSWVRDLPGSEKKEEDFLVVIWQWQMFIPAVKNHSLCDQIQEIQSQNLNKSVSLVVYGLNGYFSYLKSKSRKASDNPSSSRKRKDNIQDGEFPYLTKYSSTLKLFGGNNIEEELIELQIMAKCNHRLIESQEELGLLLVNITKAIAETPYKLDKQRRELENLEWFAVGDSRDCVAVDKAGNGLSRLWLQQLCQFNMAGHDVAQAIAKTYPSPQALMQAYDKCRSKEEGEGLLKDLMIRRCEGPISSSRRIGPELSKKIYTLFNTTDGDAPLSQEK